MQPPDFAHGWQARLLSVDVSKHLKYHEAQKQEVETEADPSHNDEGHLTVSSKGNGRLAKDTSIASSVGNTLYLQIFRQFSEG